MRFYPFGSGSFLSFVDSSSQATYARVAAEGLRAVSASWALSGSKGPVGDNGTPSTTAGPYTTYPPHCS